MLAGRITAKLRASPRGGVGSELLVNRLAMLLYRIARIATDLRIARIGLLVLVIVSPEKKFSFIEKGGGSHESRVKSKKSVN